MSKQLFTHRLYGLARQCVTDSTADPLRPVFRARGGAWHACFRRLDAGKLPPVFAKGNGKLPFFAFSSLPGVDCPGAGSCLYRDGNVSSGPITGFCYSFRSWRYPAAFMRQLINSLRLRSDQGRQEIIDNWFELPQGATVRLYVDGDFASPEILSFWFRLCFARPDLQVYGYSKSWQLLLDYAANGGRFPSNYLLNLSSGGNGTSEQLEAVRALPITRGEFIAVRTQRDHGKAYQGKHEKGFSDYACDVRAMAQRRVFVCSGKCGSCTPSGHACGSERFRNVAIAIGIH